MLHLFGNKRTVKCEPQGFSSLSPWIIHNKRVGLPRHRWDYFLIELSADANGFSGHVLYKLRVQDDALLKLKACIALYAGKDGLCVDLRTECSMCSPIKLRLLLLWASMKSRWITNIDKKPPRTDRLCRTRIICHLSHRKRVLRKIHIPIRDCCFRTGKFQHKVTCSILFYAFLYLVSANSIHIAAGVLQTTGDAGRSYVENRWRATHHIESHFKLVHISCGPVESVFGINIVQHEDFAIEVHGYDQLKAVKAIPLTWLG